MLCKKVNSRTDIEVCKNLILDFRPHLNPATVTDLVEKMIRNDSYELIYAFEESDRKAMAFAGYRKYEMLRTGKIVYIDDLFTSPDNRKKGCGNFLLSFIENEARQAQVKSIHLDSGYTLHPAHRLYLNRGFILACNHFSKDIPTVNKR
ncbi:GNAT family N-acetyltransferase [Mucilaginibacter sp. SMC90]|uniref:GNAT family N-acetyltransferase n=1 Tax=Mucilaginibacter sp. SMC90 TaxID=2929803 RepID=UPI001FB3A927|nr:GNAT family N-acetyltransferase [Mucilaginibacter sp. SMC90]UOE48838.1 GNAT family N-acetyltransferase [Mucilaginibacter sp. SMC90]